MDKHDLLAVVKDLAIELGRTPTRAEFCGKMAGGDYKLTKLFGSYTTMLTAAGLETYDERRSPGKARKITNEIFVKDLEQQMAEYKPRDTFQPARYTPTLVIPDTHFPFHSQRTLDAIYEWANRYKPERVIQVGDLYDLYAHTKFPRSQNLIMPQQEQEMGRKAAEEMWTTIKGIVPNAECIQLLGNHDLRPLKQTLAHMPSLEHVIEKYLQELMSFEGVKLVADPREPFEAEGVQYVHGFRSGYGAHMSHTLCNTVHGHDHKLGVAFRRVAGQTLWELHAGFAGDMESKVFHYTPQKALHEMPGFGWLDEKAPRAVPV